MVSAMRRWPLLRNRDYMLLWSGEVLSELGSQTSAVAYPLLILALTGSPAKAGVVGLAKWLPPALFAVPAGALADHVDRKRLMIACDATRLVAAASVVTMLILGRPPYAQIIAVAFIDGALFITSYICERGALRQVVPSDQIQDGVAQNEARTFAASIIGPPLGGILFAAARALPFIADTASFLCSMTAISLTRSDFQSTGTTSTPGPKLRSWTLDGFSCCGDIPSSESPRCCSPWETRCSPVCIYSPSCWQSSTEPPRPRSGACSRSSPSAASRGRSSPHR